MDTVTAVCRLEVLHLILAFLAGVLLSALVFTLVLYIRKKIGGPDVIQLSKAPESPDVSQPMASKETEEGLTYASLNFQENSKSQKHGSDHTRQLEIDDARKSNTDTYASVSINN
ncbi:hypothetical protein NDU88_004856 [Pleurodeles waltl]|uniref:Uncharacterized protein n=2 Tax=Pleurodeles waltl TaxID=8319 RepID=A0AAV7QDV8_PLEWA|nr:hypothetical protein NDU88_004856 [Pleurodeles waltl]